MEDCSVSPEDIEAGAEFYDKHIATIKEKHIRIRFWTKKLGDIHIEVVPRSPNEPAGLCGKPLLGNDYYRRDRYKNIDNATGQYRKVCIDCAIELQRRLDQIYKEIQNDRRK